MINYRDNFEKNKPARYDGEFEWDYLISAFNPTKIQPMDIDGIVERHDRFLIFETKDENKDIPVGQSITLTALHKLGCFTIFYINGKTKDKICKFKIWYPAKSDYEDIDLSNDIPWQIVLKKTREWFEDANCYGNKTKL